MTRLRVGEDERDEPVLRREPLGLPPRDRDGSVCDSAVCVAIATAARDRAVRRDRDGGVCDSAVRRIARTASDSAVTQGFPRSVLPRGDPCA